MKLTRLQLVLNWILCFLLFGACVFCVANNITGWAITFVILGVLSVPNLNKTQE